MLRPYAFAALSTIVVWTAATSLASAQGPAEGRALAANVCSECHAVGVEDRGVKSDAAPSFAAIAGMASTTALSIKVFLRTPHANMPDIMLSENEASAIADYILGLREK